MAAILCGALFGAAALRADEGPDPAVPPEASASGSRESPPAIEYIPLRGFAFRTPDKLFEMAIGFNLQVRFTSFDFDDVPGAVADADEFRVRRFKLYFTGYAFDPKLTYRVQLAFENVNNTKLLLDDAWVNYKFMAEISVQMGQSKTPVQPRRALQRRRHPVPGARPGRGRVQARTRHRGGHSRVTLEGRADYMAGVFSGDGQNTLRATDHVMPMIRLVANPLGQMGIGESDLEGHTAPALSFGVDGFTNTLRKTTDALFEVSPPNYASPTGWLGRNIELFRTGENVFVESGSTDVQLKWMGLSVQAEYFVGHAEGDSSGVTLRANGWYGQAGYLIVPAQGRRRRPLLGRGLQPGRAAQRDVGRHGGDGLVLQAGTT